MYKMDLVISWVCFVKITFCSQEGQAVFLCVVALVKLVAWWTRLKGLKTDASLFGQVLSTLSLYFKKRLGREILTLE